MLQQRDRNDLQIFVKSQKNMAIKVKRSDKIIDVKWKCYEIIGMSQNQIELIFQGQILNDKKTVEECEMCEASMVDIMTKLRGGMQIYARTVDGRSVEIHVTGNSKICNIKNQIKGQLGVYSEDQKFIFQSQILQNDKTLDDYKISEGSCIDVIKPRSNSIVIFARIEDGTSGAIEVSVTDKICDLKTQIESKLKLHPDDQKLIFQTQILQDDKTINECGIGEGSIIAVDKLKRIAVRVATKDARSVTLRVLKNDKISDLKIKLRDPTKCRRENNCWDHFGYGIPLTNKQNLFFQHHIIQDDQTVEECGIVDKSVINIVEKSPITVLAKTKDGKHHQLEIFADDKIIDLKKMIEVKTQLKTNDQFIMFKGGILEDDQSIWECEIYNQSVVDVLIFLAKIFKMTINIRTLDGQTNQIQVTENETIGSVKKRIQETLGIIEAIHLFYKGDILKDDTKLVSECRIYNQSTIAVIELH